VKRGLAIKEKMSNNQPSLLQDELNFVDAIDLSTVMPEVMPGIYYVFKDGGPHYFSQCTIDVDPIYKQNIWPFIYRVRQYKKAKKSGILLGSIALTKLQYILHKIYHATKTRIKRNYRSGKDDGKKICPFEMEISMHRIVAFCFIPNDDPENKIWVDHINGNRMDFRVENLRWVTPEDNGKGTPNGKNDPDEVYRRISKKDWFSGGGINLIETAKDRYFNNLKNEKQLNLWEKK